jgi:hypothetical protein
VPHGRALSRHIQQTTRARIVEMSARQIGVGTAASRSPGARSATLQGASERISAPADASAIRSSFEEKCP